VLATWAEKDSEWDERYVSTTFTPSLGWKVGLTMIEEYNSSSVNLPKLTVTPAGTAFIFWRSSYPEGRLENFYRFYK
jgi:hypothetical protein